MWWLSANASARWRHSSAAMASGSQLPSAVDSSAVCRYNNTVQLALSGKTRASCYIVHNLLKQVLGSVHYIVNAMVFQSYPLHTYLLEGTVKLTI